MAECGARSWLPRVAQPDAGAAVVARLDHRSLYSGLVADVSMPPERRLRLDGFGPGLDEIGFASGLDDAPCTGDPALTFTTVSGARSSPGRIVRLVGGSSPFGYSRCSDRSQRHAALIRGLDAALLRHEAVYCWGTTKYACESGFASAPFTEDYDWFETSTQICGPDAGINECRRDEWCTIANCSVQLTRYIRLRRHLRSRHPCRHCRRRFRLPR